jgi:co-chaperonin GroES (HSP10)
MNQMAIVSQHGDPMPLSSEISRVDAATGSPVNPVLPMDSKAIEAGNDLNDLWLGEGIETMLEAVPEPERFFLIVTQVAIRRKVGSIIIPDTAQEDQQWTHGLAMVVKVGPSAYVGKKFEDMGLSQAQCFKPGDLVQFESRAPRRFFVDGRLFMYIPDDAVMGRPKREHMHRIKFTI